MKPPTKALPLPAISHSYANRWMRLMDAYHEGVRADAYDSFADCRTAGLVSERRRLDEVSREHSLRRGARLHARRLEIRARLRRRHRFGGPRIRFSARPESRSHRSIRRQGEISALVGQGYLRQSARPSYR